MLLCLTVLMVGCERMSPTQVALNPATLSDTPALDATLPDDDATRVLERLRNGRTLFDHSWTIAEGAGHRNSRGVIDMNKAERMGSLGVNFALFATPTVTSCRACHNVPYDLPGGAGQMVTNVIVVRKPQHASNPRPGQDLDDVIVNESLPPALFGAGFVEQLATQISTDLARQRDALAPGQEVTLVSQGESFGTLSRDADGHWDTSGVTGLPASSTTVNTPDRRPTLRINPFHQVGAVATIREFTVNAFDFHLGVQAVARVGSGTDPDRDGVADELSPSALTDIVLYQASLPAPTQVWPDDARLRAKVELGQRAFDRIGCATCHRPTWMLVDDNWLFSDGEETLDLTASWLPQPRPGRRAGAVSVSVYSDFKLHDITDGPGSADRDALHLHTQPGSPEFFGGATRFLTARLWGVADRPPYFHNGRHTTLAEAIGAHAGEAAASRSAYRGLSDRERDAVLAFLRSLRVRPET